MSSYDDIEAALLVVVRQVPRYNSRNSSQGDYSILSSGVTEAIILTPGPMPERELPTRHSRLRTVWGINLEMFVAVDEAASGYKRVREIRQELLDEVAQHPTLKQQAGVVSAGIVRADAPQLWRGENRRWWSQLLIVIVEARESVTIND